MTEELKNRLLSILKFVFAVLFIAVVATLYHELAH